MKGFISLQILVIAMAECEEPGCRREEHNVWEGRRLCDMHYKLYSEQHDKIVLEMGG